MCRISFKIAVIVACEVLFFLKWRSCVLILGDHCQKRVVVNGEKVSVLIRQFELLHSLMYESMIFSRFIDVLWLGKEVNICDAMWCSRFFFFAAYFRTSLFLRICRGGSPAIQRMLGAGLVRKAPIKSLIPSL